MLNKESENEIKNQGRTNRNERNVDEKHANSAGIHSQLISQIITYTKGLFLEIALNSINHSSKLLHPIGNLNTSVDCNNWLSILVKLVNQPPTD